MTRPAIMAQGVAAAVETAAARTEKARKAAIERLMVM